MPDVSVIIVNWNVTDLLLQCVSSLYDRCGDLRLEVFVVDNASSDGGLDSIRTRFPQVRLIANESNKGFAAANNQALELAQGSYVLLLNPDTRILSSALGKMVEFMDSHPGTGALGCKVWRPDGTVQLSTRDHFPSLASMIVTTGNYLLTRGSWGLPIVRRAGRVAPGWRSPALAWASGFAASQYDRCREVKWLAGCCIMLRREALKQVGLLDERFFLFGEEIDLCYRLYKAGWALFYTPGAAIVHHSHTSTSRNPQATVHSFRSGFLYLQKHSGNLQAHVFRFLLVLIAVSGVFVEGVRYMTTSTARRTAAAAKLADLRRIVAWAICGR